MTRLAAMRAIANLRNYIPEETFSPIASSFLRQARSEDGDTRCAAARGIIRLGRIFLGIPQDDAWAGIEPLFFDSELETRWIATHSVGLTLNSIPGGKAAQLIEKLMTMCGSPGREGEIAAFLLGRLSRVLPSESTDSVAARLIQAFDDGGLDIKRNALHCFNEMACRLSENRCCEVVERIVDSLADDELCGEKDFDRSPLSPYRHMIPVAMSETVMDRLNELTHHASTTVRRRSVSAIKTIRHCIPTGRIAETARVLLDMFADRDHQVGQGAAGAFLKMIAALNLLPENERVAIIDRYMTSFETTDSVPLYLIDTDFHFGWRETIPASYRPVVVNRLLSMTHHPESGKARSAMHAVAALHRAIPLSMLEAVFTRIIEMSHGESRRTACNALADILDTVDEAGRLIVLDRLFELAADSDERVKGEALHMLGINEDSIPENRAPTVAKLLLQDLKPSMERGELSAYDMNQLGSALRKTPRELREVFLPKVEIDSLVEELINLVGQGYEEDCMDAAAAIASLGWIMPEVQVAATIGRLEEMPMDIHGQAPMAAGYAIGGLLSCLPVRERIETLNRFLDPEGERGEYQLPCVLSDLGTDIPPECLNRSMEAMLRFTEDDYPEDVRRTAVEALERLGSIEVAWREQTADRLILLLDDDDIYHWAMRTIGSLKESIPEAKWPIIVDRFIELIDHRLYGHVGGQLAKSLCEFGSLIPPEKREKIVMQMLDIFRHEPDDAEVWPVAHGLKELTSHVPKPLQVEIAKALERE